MQPARPFYKISVASCLLSLFVHTAFADGSPKRSEETIERKTYPEVTFGPALNGALGALDESFESSTFPPPGWIKLNPDGGPGWNRQVNGTSPVPGWVGGTITAPPGGGDAVAFCTWTTGGTTSNDQWLVTPQIASVQPGDSLKFMLRYWPNAFNDTLEIRISTTTPTVGGLSVLVATLGFTGSSSEEWTEYGYRLTDFVSAGSNIYIAFRERVLDNENDGASISLDLVEVTSTATSVGNDGRIPNEFLLHQNYPNPFNPSTTIQYAIAARSMVQLQVYDLLGQEVATLVSEEKSPGLYSATWNAAGHSSGVYLYKLQAGNYSEIKKLMLAK